MHNKTAIITGLTGQDGSYLADILIEQGVKIYGLVRRTSRGTNLNCAEHLQDNPLLEVVEGDLLDQSSLERLCKLARADMCYHMASQSHVGTSFIQPAYTAQATGLGTLNLLEAIRQSGYHTKFLNAATSELFGGIYREACNEETPFYPKSPYATAKLFGLWITRNYCESYKIFACNSICFNHESPRRGDTFVTRKITKAVANIIAGYQNKVYLGNLDACRDWGFAKDFCNAMVMILTQLPEPDDFILATGETHSVREFCEIAFEYAGLGDYQRYVEIDPRFYRPNEVETLIGDYNKIYNRLGWKPTTTFRQLVEIMVDHDLGLHGLSVAKK